MPRFQIGELIAHRKYWNIASMNSDRSRKVLVTGACGQIGCAVAQLLSTAGRDILRIDVGRDTPEGVLSCDLTSRNEVSRLFQSHSIGAVIHLAGILPTAFQSNPLSAADVNLSGSLTLMRNATESRVSRFVFASSMSVYGTTLNRAVTEDDFVIPEDAYGASKRAIELIGETLRKAAILPFVSLRIARVVGPGIKKSSSSQWRSQIFETRPEVASSQGFTSIHIPYSPETMLSLVHVEDVARMLVTLLDAPITKNAFYNSPAEMCTAKELKEVVEELKGISVELDENGAQSGPVCDGSRFAQEFGFHLRGLRDHLSSGSQTEFTDGTGK
jgi:nucleoside-diphosphate-sugar epimerase